MIHDNHYIFQPEQPKSTDEPNAKFTLKKKVALSCCQAVGELLFATITCRPSILYLIIELSQYNKTPSISTT